MSSAPPSVGAALSAVVSSSRPQVASGSTACGLHVQRASSSGSSGLRPSVSTVAEKRSHEDAANVVGRSARRRLVASPVERGSEEGSRVVRCASPSSVAASCEGRVPCQGSSSTIGEGGALCSLAVASVDRACCLARLVRDGKVVQCKSRAMRGSATCFQHRSVRGVSRARYGLLDGDVPSAALEEFHSLLNSAESTTASHVSSGDIPPAQAAKRSHASSVPNASQRVSGARSRVVSGFGEERVEDVAGDEERRCREGILRAARRRESGERGRARDFQDRDLDRGCGGAWRLGR